MLKLALLLRRLAKNESGAVTVDWVALTAGVVVVGLAIVWFIMDQGVDVLAGSIVDNLTGIDLTATPTAPTFDGQADGAGG